MASLDKIYLWNRQVLFLGNDNRAFVPAAQPQVVSATYASHEGGLPAAIDGHLRGGQSKDKRLFLILGVVVQRKLAAGLRGSGTLCDVARTGKSASWAGRRTERAALEAGGVGDGREWADDRRAEIGTDLVGPMRPASR
jgi:hypothetical protein